MVEWTSSTISIHLPEGQNVRIINKGKYNERAEYHPRTPHPLLVEIYYPQGQYFDRNIKRFAASVMAGTQYAGAIISMVHLPSDIRPDVK